ncbi:MAG: hypothetical protein WB806_02425 [Xanthobacteraceae bacterium]
MANNVLAQSGIDIGLPVEADYDAAYAAVTATERGRWFLTELANRNRRADTDALMAAIERVEGAVRSGEPAKQSRRLPDVNAAAERLADIAFELRERGADAALCDALDTAVREISTASGGDAKTRENENGGTPERTIAEPARQAAGDAVDADSPSSGDAFDMPLQDSAKFAAAASALAASLAVLSGEAEAPSEQQNTSSVTVAILPHDYAVATAPQPAVAAEQGPRWHIEAPEFVFHRPQREANDRMAESSGVSNGPQPLVPGLQLLPSPDEDPAELFEPPTKRVAVLPAAAPKPAPTPLASAVSAAAQAVRTADNPPPRSATGPTVRPMPPRPAPINPLAALRGLTEDELIALFG